MVVRCLAIAAVFAASVAEPRDGRILASVERIVDGDTVWLSRGGGPEVFQRFKLRLVDVDAPERGPRAQCAGERALAEKAKTRLGELTAGRPVWAAISGRGGYGRFIGRLETTDGDVGAVLMAEGLARPWSKAAPPVDWCG